MLLIEWYFLFAYAILRSIPNKLGEVVALLASIFILFCHIYIKVVLRGLSFRSLSKNVLLILIADFLVLTLIGKKPVE